ncbi:ubiquitin carboxyl-terminal hydrolase 25 [Platysternon megacephalum]|uniref:Ubiquitin carboxyl-terminal hydrolase 25 n=1 Tax=Platysternon megacephalum TaxID=55544 RepID=A0A4D9DYV2_9SAUR|nr:ubiquitin carboxyl-terminal hydrolase 25 [Platysternon megacephalum]
MREKKIYTRVEKNPQNSGTPTFTHKPNPLAVTGQVDDADVQTMAVYGLLGMAGLCRLGGPLLGLVCKWSYSPAADGHPSPFQHALPSTAIVTKQSLPTKLEQTL